MKISLSQILQMDYLSLHVDVGMGGGDSGREIGEPLERETHQQQPQIGPTRRRLHRRRRSGKSRNVLIFNSTIVFFIAIQRFFYPYIEV